MAAESTGTVRDVARLVDAGELRRRCAASTARRLVSGAGSLSLVAYRQSPERELPALAHGVTERGLWLVALGPSASGDSRPAAEETAVRVQVDQLGAPAEFSVQTASLHGLGRMRLLDPVEAERLLGGQQVAAPLAAAAASPGARLAVVEVGSVLVHAREDVEKLPWSQVAGQAVFPVGADEWEAADLVAGMDDHVVAQVLQELLQGRSRGLLGRPLTLPEEETSAHRALAAGRPLLLDVDSEGCTWLVGEAPTEGGVVTVRTVFLAFEHPVRDLAGLVEVLRDWQALVV